MSRQQYRITVNKTNSEVLDAYPGDRWRQATEYAEQRGGSAVFSRRLVTDLGFKEFFPDGVLPAGYFTIDKTVVCPWEVIAEAGDEYQSGIIVYVAGENQAA